MTLNFFPRTLIAITEKYFGPNYFDQNLSGAQADQEVLKDIMMEKLPDLYHHLDDLDIEISTVTLNWFLALFFDAVPLEVRSILLLFDCCGSVLMFVCHMCLIVSNYKYCEVKEVSFQRNIKVWVRNLRPPFTNILHK